MDESMNISFNLKKNDEKIIWKSEMAWKLLNPMSPMIWHLLFTKNQIQKKILMIGQTHILDCILL